MKLREFATKNKSIISFLTLEALAFLAFNFGNIVSVLNLFGAVIAVFAFFFAYVLSENKKEFIKLIPPVVILFIVSGIAAFGGFSTSFTTFSNICVFIALPGFFSLGFLTRRIGDAKIKHVLLAIGFGFALLTLIGTFATWIDYGFFYSLIYKIKGTPFYYYNGAPYDVTDEMNWLFGFSFSEVSLKYGGMFGVLCGAFLPALLFISPKQKRNEFIAVSAIGGIGLISMLTVPNFKALILFVVVFIFGLIYRFAKQKSVITKSFSLAAFIIIGLGVLFFVVTIISAAIGFKFLPRLFINNRFMSEPSEILKAIFAKDNSGSLVNLFGLDRSARYVYFDTEMINLNSITYKNSGIFEIELLKEVGIFGTLIFIFFLCGMIYFVAKYIKEENDESPIKVVVVTLLLAFFLYASLSWDIVPETHNSDNYAAFLRSGTTMIAMFLLGLVYFAPKAKEENK